MDLLFELYCFFMILNYRSIQIILKNAKSMASIAILAHSMLSISAVFLIYSIKYLLRSMQNSILANALPIMLKYISCLLLVQFAFIFAFLMISNFSSMATILISAASHADKNLPFKDLFSRIKKTWTRPLKTGFRASRTKTMRHSFVAIFLVVIIHVLYPKLVIMFIVLIGIVFGLIYLYSGVAWTLAIVVSVLEESYGNDALEKAEELVKGHMVHGVLINVFFTLLALIPFLCYWFIFSKKGMLNIVVSWLFLVNVVHLVKMYGVVSYTIVYFECKKYVGEEIGFLGGVEYTKVANDVSQV